MQQIEVAISYAQRGIKVFPCNPKTKSPMLRGENGFLDATSDLRKIKAWWKKHPNAMVGSPNDQFTVIDIDDYDLCPTGKMLTNMAMEKLRASGVVSDSTLRVKTKSGGTHLYFKNNPIIRRSIQCLPNIDLLANGGYVILPDQNNYVANVDSPWEKIDSLEEFNFEAFSYLKDEMVDFTKAAKKLKGTSPAKSAKREKATASPMHAMETDIRGQLVVMKEAERLGKQLGSINYQADSVNFEEMADLYEKAGAIVEAANPYAELLVDGKIDLNAGSLNTEMVNSLFHNKEVQKRMAKSLGIRVPTGGERGLMHSIIPFHTDARSSMGIRWAEDGSHIIARDFANFYGSEHNNCDYNLVRLFATTMYKANVQRLSPAEFVVWFTRLLHEAGVIDVMKNAKQFYRSTDGLTPAEKKVAEGYQLLDACKSMYAGYSGSCTFADKFSAAWCGVGYSSVGRIKRKLVSKGYLEYTGVYDCSGGKRDDGFFETPLYAIVTEKKIRVDGVVLNKEVRELQERRKVEMNKSDKEDSHKVSLSTIYGMQITEESHQKVRNFCKDFGIDTCVLHKNMFMPVLYSTKFIEEVINNSDTTYFVDDFELILEKPNKDGMRPLVAVGYCEDYDQVWKEMDSKYGDVKDDGFEEPSSHFVIAYDVDPEAIKDMDYLEAKFNEYCQSLAFHGTRTMFLPEAQLEQIIDGRQPTEE